MIDLRSDTVTKPTPEMRQAMANAEVGDDVMGEDPTVNALEANIAQRLGKQAALFVPSGTMSNLLAYLAQAHPGQSIILNAKSHPYRYEGGNMAIVGGLLPRLLDGPLGKISAEDVANAIVQIDDPHFSNTAVVSIENTTNDGGGAYYTQEEVAAISAVTHDASLKLHCDGARFFHATVATGIAPQDYAQHCDTISICLSKGLGAPVGSCLVGDTETIHHARRFRKILGGGMRQAGILAAAGLHALEHHIQDLAEDHRRTQQYREALEAIGVQFQRPSPTNILFLQFDDAPKIQNALQEKGILTMLKNQHHLRLVFHRDITDNDLEKTITTFKSILS